MKKFLSSVGILLISVPLWAQYNTGSGVQSPLSGTGFGGVGLDSNTATGAAPTPSLNNSTINRGNNFQTTNPQQPENQFQGLNQNPGSTNDGTGNSMGFGSSQGTGIGAGIETGAGTDSGTGNFGTGPAPENFPQYSP